MFSLLQNIESNKIKEKFAELSKDFQKRSEIHSLILNDQIDEGLILTGQLFPNFDDHFDVFFL